MRPVLFAAATALAIGLSAAGTPAGAQTAATDAADPYIWLEDATGANDSKDAIVRLKKTTELNPKDAQAWYLLGTARLSSEEAQRGASNAATTFSEETADAFRSCVAADPAGSYAAQAKAILDEMKANAIEKKD